MSIENLKKKLNQGFAPGDVILSSQPFVHVISRQFKDSHCHECFLETESTQFCAQCHNVKYCSKKCQTKAWKKFHKVECKIFKNCIPKYGHPLDTVVYLLRIAIRKKKDDYEVTGRTFNHLMNHADEVKKDTYRMEQFLQILGTLKMICGDYFELPSEEILFDYFCKLCINGCTIFGKDAATQIGAGIYLDVSIFDHSCTPNTYQAYFGSKSVLRAIEHIQPNSFPTVSYINLNDPRNIRQKNLWEGYYFICECPRCSDDTDSSIDKMLLSALCPRCSKGCILPDDDGFLTSRKCDACGEEGSKEASDLYEMTMKMAENNLERLQTASIFDSGDLKKINRYKEVLHPCNFVNFTLLTMESKKNLYSKQFEKALSNFESILEIEKRLNFLTKMTTLMMAGKLLILFKRLVKARFFLKEALELVALCYGKDHSLYAQCREMLFETN